MKAARIFKISCEPNKSCIYILTDSAESRIHVCLAVAQKIMQNEYQLNKKKATLVVTAIKGGIFGCSSMCKWTWNCKLYERVIFRGS